VSLENSLTPWAESEIEVLSIAVKFGTHTHTSLAVEPALAVPNRLAFVSTQSFLLTLAN
jgi:hypothetical protein